MKLSLVTTLALVLSSAMLARAWADDLATHPENVWLKQSPRPDAPVPHFGWEASGAYDPYVKKWIHWGGHDGEPQGFALFLWDPQTAKWEQKFPDTSPPGVCCVDGAETFDMVNRRFVRFPGASGNHGWQWSRKLQLKNSAVWLYDAAANSWINMRPAPYQAPERYSKQVLGSLNACGTYDARHEVALSFGGQDDAGETMLYGTKSGRNCDKLALAGARTTPASKIDCVLLTDAAANYECRLIAETAMGGHVVLFGEAVAAHVADPPVRRLYIIGPG